MTIDARQMAEDAHDRYSQDPPPGQFARAVMRRLPIHSHRLLQDLGSVKALDAQRHRHRKAMFTDMMTPENTDRLLTITKEQWHKHLVA